MAAYHQRQRSVRMTAYLRVSIGGSINGGTRYGSVIKRNGIGISEKQRQQA